MIVKPSFFRKVSLEKCVICRDISQEILDKRNEKRDDAPELHPGSEFNTARSCLITACISRGTTNCTCPLPGYFPPHSLPPFPFTFTWCRAENGRSRHTGDPLGIPFVTTAAKGEIDLSRDYSLNSLAPPLRSFLRASEDHAVGTGL